MLGARARQPVAAQIVGPPFQQRHFRGSAQGRRHQRQVLGEKLVLERPCSRGDQDADSRQQRRNEICECLPGSGTGFYRERLATLHGRGYPLSHSQLLAPDLEVRQGTLQRSVVPKYVRKIKHSRRTLPCVSHPVEASFLVGEGENAAARAVMEQNGAYCPIYEGILRRPAIISGATHGSPELAAQCGKRPG